MILGPGELIIDQIEHYDENDWGILFSDGGCHVPEDLAGSSAGWSVHSRTGCTFCGGKQTPMAGEVEAAVQAALVAGTGALLYTDSRYVFNIISKRGTPLGLGNRSACGQMVAIMASSPRGIPLQMDQITYGIGRSPGQRVDKT